MCQKTIFLMGLLVAPFLFLEAQPNPGPTVPPVALVIWLEGEVRVGPEAKAPALELLTPLRPGDRLQTTNGSRLELVFRNGRRFAVQAHSIALVEEYGVQRISGRVDELDAVPVLADLPAIDPLENPGRHAGAERLRQTRSRLFELSPKGRTAVAHDDATLHFTAVDGVETYRVEITDSAGRSLFSTETQDTRVRIPANVLQPGELHYWQVSSGGVHAHTLHGSALFVALGNEASRARRDLAERSGKDLGLHVLRAAIEIHMGRDDAACGLLDQALTLAPPNPSLGKLQAETCTR